MTRDKWNKRGDFYKNKFYNKLGLESLKDRHWYRKYCACYKIFKKKPNHLSIFHPNYGKESIV